MQRRKRKKFESSRSKLFLILTIFGALAALSYIAPPVLEALDRLNKNQTFNLVGSSILFAFVLVVAGLMLVFAFANRRRGPR